MDSFASDRKLSELGELDLQDLLDQSDLFDDVEERRQLTNRHSRPTSDDMVNGDCVSHHVFACRHSADVFGSKWTCLAVLSHKICVMSVSS